jgi:hypothetical protein
MATPIYIISITNPTSENETNYRQEITIIQQGPRARATTTFPASAPGGLAGTTLTGDFASVSSVGYEALAKELILTIQRTFEGKGANVTLAITEVKSPPPPPTPPPTPQSTDEQRKKDEAAANSNTQKVLPVDDEDINNANTEKPKGTAKLGIIITNLGKKIIITLIPIAINIVLQLITQIVENEIAKAKEKAKAEQQKIQDQITVLETKQKSGTRGLETQISSLTAKKESIPITTQITEDNLRAQLTNFGSFSFAELPAQIPGILGTVFANGCPNPNSPTIRKIITLRNGLVVSLNAVGTQLDIVTNTITGLSSFLDITEIVLTSLDIAKAAISIASKAIPSPPGIPGVITSGLADLETIIRKKLFTPLGEARLPKVAGSIAAAAIPISIINKYIQQIVAILSALDLKLKQCVPDLASNTSSPGLTPISNSLVSIAAQQTQANNTANQVTYAGFLIEIETIPYTPTVNRYRAVGKNQSGIILIQTELSFTLEPQILINELKLIIDRDNLKAY